MAVIKQDFTKTPLRAFSGADSTFSLQFELQAEVVTEGTSVVETVGDCNMVTHTPAVYHYGGRITRRNSISSGAYTNLTPDVAVINGDGTTSRVSSGIAEFLYTEGGVTRKIVCDFRDITGTETVYELSSYVAGTLAEHASLQIDNLIDNTMTMEANGKLYTTQDHSAPAYVRNPNFWGASLDLTCISPWNSNNANRKAGTLVTPRHIINAAHYEYNVGTVVRFIAADNTVVDRTIVGKKRHPDYVPYSPDLTIYTLDSDVATGINFCKVMPSDAFSYITKSNLGYSRIPAIRLDQEEKGLIGDMADPASFIYPTDETRLIFNEGVIGGDSGNPAFLVVNGELVLVTVWTYGGGGSGTEIRAFISDIDQMIVDSDANAGVSTGYTLTAADFSSFLTPQ